MDEPTPQSWAREAWSNSRLDILIPVAAGLAVAQFLTAVFALRSYHNILLSACLVAVGFAMLRSFMFLYRLSRDSREAVTTDLTARDLRWLFLPLILSAGVYGAIAPNYRLAAFFIFALLPHALCLLYLIKRYAHTPAQTQVSVPTFEAIGEGVLALARAFRKTPYVKQP